MNPEAAEPPPRKSCAPPRASMPARALPCLLQEWGPRDQASPAPAWPVGSSGQQLLEEKCPPWAPVRPRREAPRRALGMRPW